MSENPHADGTECPARCAWKGDGGHRSMTPSRVHGEPQPASRVYRTRMGAENHVAREQAYSDKIGDDLAWTVEEVEGGWAAFATERPETCTSCGETSPTVRWVSISDTDFLSSLLCTRCEG